MSVSSKKILIREAVLEDAPRLLTLMEQLGYPISLHDMQDRLNVYGQSPWYRLFVAEKNKIIIGCVALAISEAIVFKTRVARVTALIIDETQRRQGVGKQLMQRGEEYASQQGCSIIELTSGKRRAALGAHDFYHKLGYKNEDQFAKLYLRKELTID